LVGQVQKMVISLNLHLEFPASIHRELVDDDFCEEAMVHVSVPESRYGRLSETLTEEAVDELKASTEETGGDYKNVGEDVDAPHIYPPQYPYQPTVHQPIAIGGTVPLLLCHYPTLLSI